MGGLDRAPQYGVLKNLRRQRGLSLVRVEKLSRRIAREHKNPRWIVTSGRLSQIENDGTVPGIHKLASLGTIYDVPLQHLLKAYGIEFELPATHRTNGEELLIF